MDSHHSEYFLGWGGRAGLLNLDTSDVSDHVVLCCGGCALRCRMDNSVSGLSPSRPAAPPPNPAVKTKNVSRCCQMSVGGAELTPVERVVMKKAVVFKVWSSEQQQCLGTCLTSTSFGPPQNLLIRTWGGWGLQSVFERALQVIRLSGVIVTRTQPGLGSSWVLGVGGRL